MKNLMKNSICLLGLSVLIGPSVGFAAIKAATPESDTPPAAQSVPTVTADGTFYVEEITRAKFNAKQPKVNITTEDNGKGQLIEQHTLIQQPFDDDFEIKDFLASSAGLKISGLDPKIRALDTFRFKQFAIGLDDKNKKRVDEDGVETYRVPFSGRVMYARGTMHVYGHIKVVVPDSCTLTDEPINCTENESVIYWHYVNKDHDLSVFTKAIRAIMPAMLADTASLEANHPRAGKILPKVADTLKARIVRAVRGLQVENDVAPN